MGQKGMEKKAETRHISVIVLGNCQVGKTSMIIRYTEDKFSESFSTTLGVDFKMKKMELDGWNVKMQIWDTSGQERFRTITKNYYEKAMGVVLVYDATDPKSFEEIENWMQQLDNHAKPFTQKVLVGAKYDKDNVKITPEQGKELGEEYGIRFFQTSSKTGENVDETFNFLARAVLENNIDIKMLKNSIAVKADPESTRAKSKSKCC
eukprot:TRINITY_DN30148_c0_g1_i1.p1 TRINITY_DN30148_c0_g1~~TRINITY_DN30148_c0_g1_i1.p1  ORF type:complete len:207 (-),score=29.22 TRINITY_DN30148_c0_g1_i1:135-755(-)